MDDKRLVFSVTLADCEVQTFRAGGKGGQNQNKRETGVRIIHHPSGARGECREERSQLQNKKIAFRRMAETFTFRLWVKKVLSTVPTPEERVKRDLAPENIMIEAMEGGEWSVVG